MRLFDRKICFTCADEFFISILCHKETKQKRSSSYAVHVIEKEGLHSVSDLHEILLLVCVVQGVPK